MTVVEAARTAQGGPDAPATLRPSDVIRSGLCIGCGSCVAQATTDAGGDLASGPDAPRMAFDRDGLLRPAGSRHWRTTPSARFAATCPFSPAAADETTIAADLFGGAPDAHPSSGPFRAAFVGHVLEDGFRANGSSGGMVSWVLAELLRRGLIDGAAHVVPADPSTEGRLFRYRVSRSVADVHEGAKSRYYPIDLADVLAEIRATPGRYAIVGVPCFVKAVQLLRRSDELIAERVVMTLGLFCGHMKSARFVESFAWQMGARIEDVAAVEFRRKDPTRPASTYTAQLQLTDGRTLVRDWWNLVDGDWGAGFFQSSACNACDDVTAETADISFGDAWVEPYSSDGNGTNVVIARSALAEELLRDGIADGRLRLEPVDGDFVQATQAAGLRQRREGFAYRLTWRRGGLPFGASLRPPGRVVPSRDLPARRKSIYRMRHGISRWSHRMFRLARRTGRPQVYVRWAGAAQTTYHALAYSRGRLGGWVQRWLPRA